MQVIMKTIKFHWQEFNMNKTTQSIILHIIYLLLDELIENINFQNKTFSVHDKYIKYQICEQINSQKPCVFKMNLIFLPILFFQ